MALTAPIYNSPFIIVPLYICPSPKAWDPLLSAIRAQKANFLVIVNPNNGPGSAAEPDANYLAGLRALSAASNVRILGYVSCSYGARPLTKLEEDIGRYHGWIAPSSISGGCIEPSVYWTARQEVRVDGISLTRSPSRVSASIT